MKNHNAKGKALEKAKMGKKDGSVAHRSHPTYDYHGKMASLKKTDPDDFAVARSKEKHFLKKK